MRTQDARELIYDVTDGEQVANFINHLVKANIPDELEDGWLPHFEAVDGDKLIEWLAKKLTDEDG